MILDTAQNTLTNTIQYEQNRTGFSASYNVASSTADHVMQQLQRQLQNTASSSSPWTVVGASQTDLIGFLEYTNRKTKDEARITFFQQLGHIKVVIQTLQASK